MSTFPRGFLSLAALALFLPSFAPAQTIAATTAFGSIAVGSASSSQSLLFSVPDGTVFSLDYGTDYRLDPANCAGGSCSLPVTFQPSGPGTRHGAIYAYGPGHNLLAIAPVVGIGTGAGPAAGAGIINTVVTNVQTMVPAAEFYGVAVRGVNQIYVADARNHSIFRIDPRTSTATRVAGSGTTQGGYSGDGGPGVLAFLNRPSGLAIDAAGNLLIADTNNHCIRKLDTTSGIITTIAGTGAAGFSGDGGPAASALLNSPSAVAVTSNGDILISDTNNLRVRLLSVSSGVITDFAGNGAPGFSGDGGAAVDAQFSFPIGIALDSSDSVYVADTLNHVVRKITGGVVTTYAGQGGIAGATGDGGPAANAQLDLPYGVALSGSGVLYISDASKHTIRQVGTDPSHTISGFAGTAGTAGYQGDSGSPAAALLSTPTYLALDQQNNLYLLDFGNSAVRRVTFPVATVTNGLYFIPVAPCRIADTRLPAGPFGAPALAARSIRNFVIQNSPNCAGTIPSGTDVQAYALNVTVVPHGSLDFLTVGPSITGLPTFSTLNSRDGRIKANAAIVPANLNDANRSIDVYATDDTDLVLDINGYYVPQTTAGALAYFPVTPCRITDTRQPGNVGGAQLASEETRMFMLTSVCGLPSSAQAYSLNFTAVPAGGAPVPWVTVWPAGSGPQPLVSTLNANTGTITANAAIVQAGAGGNLNIFAKRATDLIIDVNGYYAPAAASGLALHTTSPCRAYDSRYVNGQTETGPPIDGTLSVDIRTPCSLPSSAQSFVLNSTVVPTRLLDYQALWAHGTTQPKQSTLNAYDAAVTSNLAVVPTSDGLISSFTTAPTGVIFDVFGYFAP